MMLTTFFLILGILLEGTITTLPITLIFILFSAVSMRSNLVFFLAFFAGLFLDILSFKSIGWSSLYFTSLVFVIFLYQKKFEIENLQFVLALSFISSFGYLFISGVNQIILTSIVSSLFAGISFIAFSHFNKKVASYGSR